MICIISLLKEFLSVKIPSWCDTSVIRRRYWSLNSCLSTWSNVSKETITTWNHSCVCDRSSIEWFICYSASNIHKVWVGWIWKWWASVPIFELNVWLYNLTRSIIPIKTNMSVDLKNGLWYHHKHICHCPVRCCAWTALSNCIYNHGTKWSCSIVTLRRRCKEGSYGSAQNLK